MVGSGKVPAGLHSAAQRRSCGSSPPRRGRNPPTTKARCAWTGPTARAPDRLLLPRSATRSTIPIPPEPAEPACPASTPPPTALRNSPAWATPSPSAAQRSTSFTSAICATPTPSASPRAAWGPRSPRRDCTSKHRALKPSTEGIENIAFNDFTLGVDTTALVQAENIYEVSDAFSRIVGKHGSKFGGEIHADQINTHPDVIFNGSFAFNGSETGLDFADFLLGVPSSYTQGQAAAFTTAISIWPLCAGQLEGHSQFHRELRRALGPHPPLERKIQPASNAGQRRAVPGLSRRAAGAGFSRRSRRAQRSLLLRATTFPRARHSMDARLRRASLLRTSSPGPRVKPASALGYGMFYTAYEGYRPAS
jgi:hypothetical protein